MKRYPNERSKSEKGEMMGLCLVCGRYDEGNPAILSIGYHGFHFFRTMCAEAYSPRLEGLMDTVATEGRYSDRLCDEIDKMPEGLRILMIHSDCEGKLTPHECCLIRDALRHLDFSVSPLYAAMRNDATAYGNMNYDGYIQSFIWLMDRSVKTRNNVNFG